MELLSCDPSKGVEISGTCRIDDARRQRRRRVVTAPPASAAFTVQVITQRLLVEARLRTSWPIAIRWPEARAVRREHLVDQRDGASGVAPEFKLGVSDDDPARFGDLTTQPVHVETQAF